MNKTDLTEPVELNELLEFYHIKLYFDNGLFLTSWSDKETDHYLDLVGKAWELVRKFWSTIHSGNVLDHIENLELSYRESFWKLLNLVQVYKKIDKSVFGSLLSRFPRQIEYILPFKHIVQHFDSEIRSFLIRHEEAAELLLSKTEKSILPASPYTFPKSLTSGDIENIMLQYLASEIANLNYVRLIEHSKDSDLQLSVKTRLAAKKKSAELNDQVFVSGNGVKMGFQVAITKDQEELVVVDEKELILYYSYSQEWLDSLTSPADLFHLFNYPFVFTDNTGLITLLNKVSELDVMERFFMQSKNEYTNGIAFHRKDHLSHIQLQLFDYYLNQRGNSVENLIESFIKECLDPQLHSNHLQFNFPTKNSTWLEKIRFLAPELEFLLKQFQLFTSDGNIDFELLAISSAPIKFGEIASLVNSKYVYTKSEEINRLKYHFFSDQSGLFYVAPFENKYHNFYDLLVNENVLLSSFHDYQKLIIGRLVQDGYLYMDTHDFVKIKNNVLLFLVRQVHQNDVISYWHYPEAIRKEIDRLVAEDLFLARKTLFTKQEVNYFNFYLNKKEFTNGLDLRNKYLHGTNSASEQQHKNEYYILLRLIILVLLKIEDDLILDKKQNSSSID